ncbi:MAG TPA: hypothetical protein ENK07_00130 [Bacteroidetes bacterium]|nr:hypothetical protein [Bacteroidota bacterium]
MDARRWRKRLKNDVLYVLIRLLGGAVRALSTVPARRLMRALGRGVYLASPGLRHLTFENLRLAFGDELSEREIRRLARRVFEDLGVNAADALRLDRIQPTSLVTSESFHVVREALALRRGLLVATGHVGNWEVLGAYLASRGVPLTALAARIYDPRLDRLVTRLREAVGVRTIRHNRSGFGMARVLKAGGALGVLVDVRQERLGQVVRFFGRPVHAVDGPFQLAVRFGTPVVFACAWRRRDGGYRAEFELLEPPPGLDGRRKVAWLLQACTDRLESVIRRVPSQWIWMHPRWEPVAESKIRAPRKAAKVRRKAVAKV